MGHRGKSLSNLIILSACLISITVNGQKLNDYYSEIMLCRNQSGFFNKKIERDTLDIYIKKDQKNVYGILSIKKKNQTLVGESFFINSKEGYWFLVEGYGWDGANRTLDTLNKWGTIYCFDNKYKPVYYINLLHGEFGEMFFFKEYNNNLYCHLSMTEDVSPKYTDISIEYLLQMISGSNNSMHSIPVEEKAGQIIKMKRKIISIIGALRYPGG